MIVVDHIRSTGTILGGKGPGADSFDVQQTGAGFRTTLDGQGGNDTYDFQNVGSGGGSIDALVDDTGNGWDSGDQIIVDGTNNADTIVVTGSTEAPQSLAATASDTGGSLPIGTYLYQVSAVVSGVETAASSDVTVTTATNASNVDLTGAAVGGATGYKG